LGGFLILFLVRQAPRPPSSASEIIAKSPSGIAGRLEDFRSSSSTQQKSHRTSTASDVEPYLSDAVCGACRHAMANEQYRCGQLIEQYQEQQQPQFVGRHDALAKAAATQVAKEFPQTCGHCIECKPTYRRYWRFDKVIGRFGSSTTSSRDSLLQGTSFLLPSVPSKHRIPNTAIANITSYFTDLRHAFPKAEYFFDYNPSIVRLPPHKIDGKHADLSIRYVASFRVSNSHFCFHPTDRKLMMRGHRVPPKDWLGLALLDQNLRIRQDVVLDLKATAMKEAEDFRLFVLHNQLYIATYDLIAPIWIPHYHPPERTDSYATMQRIPLVFGDMTVLISSTPACAPCEGSRGYCGKNLNYFEGPSNYTSMALVEVWPSPPHTVRVIDLTVPCDRSLEPQEFKEGPTNLLPSFPTVEELFFPSLTPEQLLLTRGRGGACCIELKHPKSTALLYVGVEHVKTPSQGKARLPRGNVTDNHYLSRFYAFESKPPFHIVARSGLFCLPFPVDSHEVDDVPLVKVTTWRKLLLGHSFPACPRIHFVSGMTINADEPDSVIVAYGINDCTSRMVQISLSEIRSLLFP